MEGAAKQAEVLAFSGLADIHITADPSDSKTIVDVRGDAFPQRKTMVGRLDDKAKETITLSRGTLWFIGTALTVIPVAIVLLAYLVSGAMGYQGTIGKVNELDTRVGKLETAFADIQALKLSVNNISNDVSTVKDGQKINEAKRDDMAKTLNDIRLLLAANKLNQ